jgi:hypothetical protein
MLRILASAVVVGGAALLVVAPPVGANGPLATVTLYVDNTNPSADDSGACAVSATPCETIGYAISQAEHLSDAAITIDVVAGTYTEDESIELSGSDTLAIVGVGTGVAINPPPSCGCATTITPIITVISGDVTLSALEISGATGGGPFSPDTGDGGGIANNGILTLNSDVVAHDDTGDPGQGGGLYNSGTLVAVDSTFSDDFAGSGGGISNSGSATLTSDTFSGNNGWFENGPGGAIYNTGTAAISNATFSDNQSGTAGAGAIYNAGSLVVDDSSLSDNASSLDYGGLGGAIANAAGGVAVVQNSTLSGNEAGYPDGSGGGIANSGTVTVVGDTFTNNGANGFGGGLWSDGPAAAVVDDTFTGGRAAGNICPDCGAGGVAITSGTGTIFDDTFSGNTGYGATALYNDGSTTVANNIFGDAANRFGAECLNYGTLSDVGYNVSDDASCGMSSGTFDEVNVPDAGTGGINLGTLASNSGPTQTQAIGVGSAAFWEVPVTNCSPPDGLPQVDQRGLPRPGAGTSFCDAGAFEAQLASTSTSVVSGLNPAQYGQSVPLTATVAGSDGGGTVSFFNGSAPIPGCSNVSLAPSGGSYTASCAASALGNPSTYSIGATYNGDAADAPSDGSVLQLVTTAATTLAPAAEDLIFTTVSATLTRSFDGMPLSGQAIVFSVSGGVAICTATTNSHGVASCSVLGVSIGGTYSASYAGNGDYAASTGSAPL